VRRGLDRINTLVQEMLAYSRARTVEKRRVNVNLLLEELIETFCDEMSKRGIICEASLDEKCPDVLLDADGLERRSATWCSTRWRPAPRRRPDRTDHALREDGNIKIKVEDNAAASQRNPAAIFIPFFTTKGSKGSASASP
jgi:hypothetical protein